MSSKSIEDLKDAASVLQKVDVSAIFTSLALGIAQAQEKLDDNSIRQLIRLSEQQVAGKSLLELGFVPAFYQFEYADVSASIHLEMQASQEEELKASLKIDYYKSKGYTKEDIDWVEKSKQDKHRKEFKSSKSVIMRSTESKSVKIQNKTISMDQQKTAIQKVEDFADKMRTAENVERVETKLQSQHSLSNVTTSAGAWVNYHNGYIAAFVPKSTHPAGVLRVKEYPGTPSSFTVVSGNDLTIASSYSATLANASSQALATALGTGNKVVGLPFKSQPNAAIVIYFGFDKRERIDYNYADGTFNNTGVHDKLVALRALLASAPHVKVEIEGHTDSSGPWDYNEKLAYDRIAIVKNFFSDKQWNVTNQISESVKGERLALGGGNNLTSDNNIPNPPNGVRDPQFRKVVIKLTSDVADYFYIEGPSFNAAANPAQDIDATELIGNANGYIAKIAPLASPSVGIGFAYGGDTVNLTAVTSTQDFLDKFNLASFSNKYKAEKVQETVYLLHQDTKIEFVAYNSQTKEIEIEDLSAKENNSSANENTIIIDDTVNSDYLLKKDAETIKNPSSFAVSAAVDFRTARAYNMSLEGSASMSARLRSLPPPPEFKAYILSLINPNG